MEYRLEDYETRMVHDGKRNNREVKIYCEICGHSAWVRWQRVRKGMGRFCSKECFAVHRQQWGKEYAYTYLNPTTGRYNTRWREKDTGNTRVTTTAHFVWEQEYGEIPEGYDIHHINGDKTDDRLDNLELVEGHIHRQGIHGSNRKVIDRVVYKQCASCEEYFPESYFKTTYCRDCQKEYMREYRRNRK